MQISDHILAHLNTLRKGRDGSFIGFVNQIMHSPPPCTLRPFVGYSGLVDDSWKRQPHD